MFFVARVARIGMQSCIDAVAFGYRGAPLI
jgi:hypothetical protein